MSASFPGDPLGDTTRRMADGDEGEAYGDARTGSDYESRGHGVVADPEFIIGRGNRLGRGWGRVHGGGG